MLLNLANEALIQHGQQTNSTHLWQKVECPRVADDADNALLDLSVKEIVPRVLKKQLLRTPSNTQYFGST